MRKKSWVYSQRKGREKLGEHVYELCKRIEHEIRTARANELRFAPNATVSVDDFDKMWKVFQPLLDEAVALRERNAVKPIE